MAKTESASIRHGCVSRCAHGTRTKMVPTLPVAANGAGVRQSSLRAMLRSVSVPSTICRSTFSFIVSAPSMKRPSTLCRVAHRTLFTGFIPGPLALCPRVKPFHSSSEDVLRVYLFQRHEKKMASKQNSDEEFNHVQNNVQRRVFTKSIQGGLTSLSCVQVSFSFHMTLFFLFTFMTPLFHFLKQPFFLKQTNAFLVLFCCCCCVGTCVEYPSQFMSANL